MKITRRQIRKIIRESLEDSKSLLEMFRGWDPYNIRQAIELNGSLADVGDEEFPSPIDWIADPHGGHRKNARNWYMYDFKFASSEDAYDFWWAILNKGLAKDSQAHAPVKQRRIQPGEYGIELKGKEVQVHKRMRR